jgi:hypothetical protein
MDNFQSDDAIGRNKFKTDFGHLYKFEDTNEFDHTDLRMTACTSGCRYNVELKKRYYCINDISGATILEKIKLDAFREAYRQDKTVCQLYFNYYFDDWIAFDITRRIKYGVGLDNQGVMQLPCTTSVDNGLKDKDVIFLAYTTDMYVCDRMKICK